MYILSSDRNFHNSKLFFSRNELTKILACYSIGVSKGNWKDYAIYFGKNEASFYLFKHTLTAPDYILTKKNKSKKTNDYIFNLKVKNKNKSIFYKIDDLLILLKRKEFKII